MANYQLLHSIAQLHVRAAKPSTVVSLSYDSDATDVELSSRIAADHAVIRLSKLDNREGNTYDHFRNYQTQSQY